MRPKFSIITCTWNSMPYLDDSIASVLGQDCQDFEYIFVDGGSTDDTLDRIRAVPRPYLLLENIKGGISLAMNKGIQAANGEIVAHLHSDDYYLRPDVLSLVVKNMQSTGKEWLFGRSMPIKAGILQKEFFIAPEFSYANLLRGNFIPHPATFVHRKLLSRAGEFDPNLTYAMDYDLWLRLARLAEPVQLDIPLAAMREHEGSLTTRNQLAALDEDFKVRLKFVKTNVLAWGLHYLRYLVRRQRAIRQGAT
jgi:glycosyltransferase involved in cell wall biosynthesis